MSDVPRPTTLGWSLAALLREWRSRVAEIVHDVPRGDRGYQVLSTAVHEAPPTQAALAARLGIDRTVIVAVIDDLERAGLVERAVDPADRRARRIAATAAGRRLVTRLDARVAEAEDELLSSLAPERRADLRGLLEHAAAGAAPDDDRCSVLARD